MYKRQCKFCASTIGGLERNLKASEMLGQIYQIQKISGERVSNVVVMGTGEPMDNYDNFLKFIHILTDEHGLHISQRNITVSTCGIVPNMKRLAGEKLQITLALSLHGSTPVSYTHLFGYPAEQLKVIGITGTKGKTTTTYMVKSILEGVGHKVGLIGTIEAIIGDEVIPAKNTTPESFTIHQYFRKMVDAGCDACLLYTSRCV